MLGAFLPGHCWTQYLTAFRPLIVVLSAAAKAKISAAAKARWQRFRAQKAKK